MDWPARAPTPLEAAADRRACLHAAVVAGDASRVAALLEEAHLAAADPLVRNRVVAARVGQLESSGACGRHALLTAAAAQGSAQIVDMLLADGRADGCAPTAPPVDDRNAGRRYRAGHAYGADIRAKTLAHALNAAASTSSDVSGTLLRHVARLGDALLVDVLNVCMRIRERDHEHGAWTGAPGMGLLLETHAFKDKALNMAAYGAVQEDNAAAVIGLVQHRPTVLAMALCAVCSYRGRMPMLKAVLALPQVTAAHLIACAMSTPVQPSMPEALPFVLADARLPAAVVALLARACPRLWWKAAPAEGPDPRDGVTRAAWRWRRRGAWVLACVRSQ